MSRSIKRMASLQTLAGGKEPRSERAGPVLSVAAQQTLVKAVSSAAWYLWWAHQTKRSSGETASKPPSARPFGGVIMLCDISRP